MSLSVTKGNGVVVLTMKTNQKTDCPPICQILSLLCCGPICAVSQGLKRLPGGVHSALGTVQIMLGLFNIGLGAIITSGYFSFLTWIYAPYWIGTIFIATGIMCILTERFPSSCLVFLNACMNFGSFAIAVTAIVLYSMDLSGVGRHWWTCQLRKNDFGYGWQVTPTPEVEHITQRAVELCQQTKYMLMMSLGGLDILLIVFAVLQLCISLSVAVINIKALYKKYKDEKRDAKHLEPLLDEVTINPAV